MGSASVRGSVGFNTASALMSVLWAINIRGSRSIVFVVEGALNLRRLLLGILKFGHASLHSVVDIIILVKGVPFIYLIHELDNMSNGRKENFYW